MKSLRSQPQTAFPGTLKEVQLLNTACARIGLSETQKQHLLTRVFFDPNAVSYWVAMYQSGAAKAERYLVSMALPRGPAEAPPNAQLPKWLAPLARAVGLLS